MRGLFSICFAAVSLLAPPATAGEAQLSMILACDGTRVIQQPATQTVVRPRAEGEVGIGPTTTDTKTVFQQVRVDGQLSVIVDGDAVKVRRSLNDKWEVLSDVSITDELIQAKQAKGGLFGKDRLKIDRRTGEVSYASFAGVCSKVADDPQARRF
jgi:hypothetical protein